MANKLTVKAQILSALDNNLIGEVNSELIEKTITQNGEDFTVATQVIGSGAEEKIKVSDDIGTQGYWLIINTDDTNFVEIGFSDVSTDGDARVIKLEPGEPALFRVNGPLYAKADTADVKIKYYCFED